MSTGSYWHLDVCLSTRANVLLIGPDDITCAFLKAIRPDLQDPVTTLRGSEPFSLPAGPVGTLILINVGGFSPPDQMELHEALHDQLSGVQVISTSATSLMPMLAAKRLLRSALLQVEHDLCRRRGVSIRCAVHTFDESSSDRGPLARNAEKHCQIVRLILLAMPGAIGSKGKVRIDETFSPVSGESGRACI